MKFKNKQEQYEWWTEVIKEIQSNKVGIRAGCRELGVPFWQYYEWKERVQQFIEEGEVNLSSADANHRPKGKEKFGRRGSKNKSTEVKAGFVEVVPSTPLGRQGLRLYFKDSWSLDVPENFNSSTLSEVIKVLESL